jgi:hypothetical protein
LGIEPAEVFFPNNDFSKGRLRYKEFIKHLYKNVDQAV